MNLKEIARRSAAILAALMMLAGSAQAASFPAIVTVKSMKVYADEALSWNIGSLPMTTVVTVQFYEGDTAKISVNGREGYAAVDDMEAIAKLAKPAQFKYNSYVFQKASLSSKYMKVKKGMQVNLLATSGQWAMVENGGVVAYTNKDHLTLIEQDAGNESESESDSKTESETSVVTETFSAQVVASAMRVYKKASTSSTCLGSVKKDTTVTVHAYNSEGWAYIELNGRKGFARVSDMKRLEQTEAQPEPTPTPEPETDSYITDESISVEKRIFMFLTQEMKFNTASACGILANVEKECSFRVTAASYDGGYGIVQWTASRNTRLKSWCKSNDYDYKSLEGQLWYLKYELENHYPKILKHMQSVANTPAGAYDAGYYFCYNFEIPANRAANSVARGNLAKDKYWQKYAA